MSSSAAVAVEFFYPFIFSIQAVYTANAKSLRLVASCVAAESIESFYQVASAHLSGVQEFV